VTDVTGYFRAAMREWWKDDQALAYAVLEQGRASCEKLMAEATSGLDGVRLRTAHHGFGLAGYAVSDHLLRGVRPAVWLMIEESGPVVLPGAEGPAQPLLFAVHGSAAVERCFEIPWLLNQMQVAHRAVRQAHTALTALLGVPAAAALTIEATRAGHLDRSWQQAHLRPPTLRETLAVAA
jgi:hypothetical protein